MNKSGHDQPKDSPSPRASARPVPAQRNTSTGLAIDTRRFLRFDMIFAPQKPVNVHGRILFCEDALRVSTVHAYWLPFVIVDSTGTPFNVSAFGVGNIFLHKVQALTGKCVKLINCGISWAIQVTGPAPNQRFVVMYNGPHSAYINSSNNKDQASSIEEAREDPSIIKELPEGTADQLLDSSVQRPPSRSQPQAVQDNLDDLTTFQCDHCKFPERKRCPGCGLSHPQPCELCSLLDCDDIVPHCPKDGHRHKKVKYL